MLLIALESVEPCVFLPSFECQLAKSKERAGIQLMAWLSKSAWEDRLTNTSLDELTGEVEPRQYDSFLAQIHLTMPSVLRNFVRKYRVRTEAVINIIRRDHFEEVLLILADIAPKLPTDPSDNIYWPAELISRPQSSDAVAPIPGDDVDDPVPELINRAIEVSARVKEVREALLARTQSTRPTYLTDLRRKTLVCVSS